MRADRAHVASYSWVSMETRLHSTRHLKGKPSGPSLCPDSVSKQILIEFVGLLILLMCSRQGPAPVNPVPEGEGGKLTAPSFHVLSRRTACSPLCFCSTGLENFAECQQRLVRWDTGSTNINDVDSLCIRAPGCFFRTLVA